MGLICNVIKAVNPVVHMIISTKHYFQFFIKESS